MEVSKFSVVPMTIPQQIMATYLMQYMSVNHPNLINDDSFCLLDIVRLALSPEFGVDCTLALIADLDGPLWRLPDAEFKHAAYKLLSE